MVDLFTVSFDGSVLDCSCGDEIKLFPFHCCGQPSNSSLELAIYEVCCNAGKALLTGQPPTTVTATASPDAVSVKLCQGFPPPIFARPRVESGDHQRRKRRKIPTYARQGFGLGLAVVVRAIPAIKLSSVMKLIIDLLEISSSMKGQEAKDNLLGRLFAYGSLARSG